MGGISYIEFVSRGGKRVVLSGIQLVLVLCSVGVVAVGCYRADRSNENREEQSDGGALQDADGVVGSNGDNGEDIDRVPNPQDGNEPAIERST